MSIISGKKKILCAKRNETAKKKMEIVCILQCCALMNPGGGWSFTRNLLNAALC